MFKIFLLVLIYASVGLAQFDSLSIVTKSGPLRGKRYEFKSKFNQKSINAFIGIPYAKPPIGVNRFERPQPMNIWKTEKDVTNNRVMCPQVYQRFNFESNHGIREDEDCLYLNIFIPITTQPMNGFPVMVYLHGGQYQFGGKDFYPPQYLLDNDIILVTINYRLGVLGFLSTGDDISVGNFAIYDQISALKWISNNIEYFGGNRLNLTIFGHDSGAISASILMTCPQAWGLFHNVMTLSGSAFTPSAVKLYDSKLVLGFSQSLNCELKYSVLEQNVSKDIINCLRTKSIQELMWASRLPGLYPNQFQFSFGPVIDHNVSSPLIVDHPINLFRSGNYWKTPLVAGLTLNEGSLDYYTYYDQIKDWTLAQKISYIFGKYEYKEFYSKLLFKSVDWFYFKRLNDTISAFNPFNAYDNKNKYPFNQINNNYIRNANNQFDSGWYEREKEDQTLIESLGDFLYGSANTLLLDLHSLNALQSTYLYVVEHKGLKSFGTLQRNSSQIIHRNQYGVTHMDDIFYLFPTLYSDNITSSYDEPLIRTMCQYFAYFAKYGRFGQNNAISNYQVFGTNWTPYSIQNPFYMRFLSQNSQIMRGFRSNYLSFWNYFIREIFDEIYGKTNNESQISAQFIGTVQLRGMIKFGDNKFVIS